LKSARLTSSNNAAAANCKACADGVGSLSGLILDVKKVFIESSMTGLGKIL
jgi:hypothetical protein